MKPEELIKAVRLEFGYSKYQHVDPDRQQKIEDEIVAILEKQIPRKPVGWDEDCGECGYTLDDYPNVCPNCGQTVDWGDQI